jgi:NADH-quinone oxidoreductase subunit L
MMAIPASAALRLPVPVCLFHADPTISSGLLQLYICWELVGLASYLLIGFWYEKFSASEAGKKAFVVTRFGDVGFFMGLVFLTIYYGNLEIHQVNSAAVAQAMPSWLIGTAALLIFCGVMGKSAQFTIHVWLPDAMEGPTPVSALLHSATMAAAASISLPGSNFFSASPPPGCGPAIGTITMLLHHPVWYNDIK